MLTEDGYSLEKLLDVSSMIQREESHSNTPVFLFSLWQGSWLQTIDSHDAS